MKVKVQLHAVLRDLLPGGKGAVDVPEGATVTSLLDQLEIDEELRELVTLNGDQISDFDSTALAEGDEVQVFPAVAGGVRSPYLDEGIRLFNEGNYFLAHETLEEYWIEAEAEERDFYQGLIHVAVGFHHLVRGNSVGAALQFRKARGRLEGYPDEVDGVDVRGIKQFLDEAPARVEKGDPVDPPTLDVSR
jgi:hypothetical protein